MTYIFAQKYDDLLFNYEGNLCCWSCLETIDFKDGECIEVDRV